MDCLTLMLPNVNSGGTKRKPMSLRGLCDGDLVGLLRLGANPPSGLRLKAPRGGFGAEDAAFVATAPTSAAIQPAPAGFASVIVADFPTLFAEFRRKRFTLLWRGSRNGFSARLSWLLRRPCAHSACGTGLSDPKAIFRTQMRKQSPVSASRSRRGGRLFTVPIQSFRCFCFSLRFSCFFRLCSSATC
jgi:hypothetical protein